MQISRRRALIGAGAAAVVAGVPRAVQGGELPLNDAKTREALELLGQLNPERQESSLVAMRVLLDVQRENESNGFMTEDDVSAARQRQIRGMRP